MNRLPLVAALVAAAWVSSGFAADPLKVGPDVYRLLFENERVRVLEVTFKPGTKIGFHSHPDHLAYAVTGGLLRLSPQGGKTMDARLDHGAVLYIPAETHAAENVGPTTIKVIVTELKETPAHGKPHH